MKLENHDNLMESPNMYSNNNYLGSGCIQTKVRNIWTNLCLFGQVVFGLTLYSKSTHTSTCPNNVA